MGLGHGSGAQAHLWSRTTAWAIALPWLVRKLLVRFCTWGKFIDTTSELHKLFRDSPKMKCLLERCNVAVHDEQQSKSKKSKYWNRFSSLVGCLSTYLSQHWSVAWRVWSLVWPLLPMRAAAPLPRRPSVLGSSKRLKTTSSLPQVSFSKTVLRNQVSCANLCKRELCSTMMLMSSSMPLWPVCAH